MTTFAERYEKYLNEDSDIRHHCQLTINLDKDFRKELLTEVLNDCKRLLQSQPSMTQQQDNAEKNEWEDFKQETSYTRVDFERRIKREISYYAPAVFTCAGIYFERLVNKLKKSSITQNDLLVVFAGCLLLADKFITEQRSIFEKRDFASLLRLDSIAIYAAVLFDNI